MNLDYNNAYMIDFYVYTNNGENIDISQTTEEWLVNMMENHFIIWVTEIHLGKDQFIDPKTNKKYNRTYLVENKIYAYKVCSSVDHEYVLKPATEEEIERYSLDPKYVVKYEIPNKTIKFTKALGAYFLPDNVHASYNYGYINRYRNEKEKELSVLNNHIDIIKENHEIHTFSLEEAKKALSKVYNVPVNEIVIDIQ